jgi:3',5'-cyclic AMP phosphodiesterase CpdA
MNGRITRRQALGEMLAGAALLAAGCGGSGGSGGSGRAPGPGGAGGSGGSASAGGPGGAAGIHAPGSTVAATWADPGGTGILARGPGERLLMRTELGPARRGGHTLATIAHVTDAHVLDASSPARVPFLDRVGAPFQSTFRPQETLTTQVLAGALRAIRELGPDVVIQGGDLIDNDQRNELANALALMNGGIVRPGSGARGRYVGVQSESNPDPFYYRPEIDAPRYPGLLDRAIRPFATRAVGRPWYPVLGDHDILVAGEIAPTTRTRALAHGDEALWELPPGLELPPRSELVPGSSPDGPPSPELVDRFLAQALAGPKVRVPSDPARAEMDATEVVIRLQHAGATRTTSATGPTTGRLDYHIDAGPNVRLIVLDLARRDGGSGGLVAPDQPDWLAAQLAAAADRFIIAVSHQPLPSSEGGDQLLAVLDQHPRVIAAIAGHTHRNMIVPRPTRAGGYWLITTSSLVDYPQQARAIRVIDTGAGGVAIHTWMLDHTFPGELGAISRQLAYLDAQGGRPKGFAGARSDRNAILYLRTGG